MFTSEAPPVPSKNDVRATSEKSPIGLLKMATSKFQRLVDQIMTGNPFVYMNLPPNLGIHARAQYGEA